MELDQIALVADVVQAIAVVATLIFVGMQVRYNTRIARMTAAQTSAQLLAENLGRVTDSPDLAELLSGGRGTLGDFTDAERLRVSNFVSSGFRHLEVLHAHRRYDIYEEELWQGAAGRLRRMLSNPRIQDWWVDNKDIYAASFRDYVATEIETLHANAGNP
jgi:hypothetical protein